MKDIAVRFGIKNRSTINKIDTYIISNAGKEFSYNSIKKMLDIKAIQSVVDYVSFFEDAYLIFSVPRFSYSFKQQQVNPRKAYVIDNGFAINNSASFSKDKGRMLENLVFLTLRRKFKDIFYFQEKKECDFLIKKDEKIIKSSNKKRTMKTWREFWAEACKGKKFENRKAVNDYMKEMAKKYKAMKNK